MRAWRPDIVPLTSLPYHSPAAGTLLQFGVLPTRTTWVASTWWAVRIEAESALPCQPAQLGSMRPPPWPRLTRRGCGTTLWSGTASQTSRRPILSAVPGPSVQGHCRHLHQSVIRRARVSSFDVDPHSFAEDSLSHFSRASTRLGGQDDEDKLLGLLNAEVAVGNASARIDAYITLRQGGSQPLPQLTDEALRTLCYCVAASGLSGVLSDLMDDLNSQDRTDRPQAGLLRGTGTDRPSFWTRRSDAACSILSGLAQLEWRQNEQLSDTNVQLGGIAFADRDNQGRALSMLDQEFQLAKTQGKPQGVLQHLTASAALRVLETIVSSDQLHSLAKLAVALWYHYVRAGTEVGDTSLLLCHRLIRHAAGMSSNQDVWAEGMGHEGVYATIDELLYAMINHLIKGEVRPPPAGVLGQFFDAKQVTALVDGAMPPYLERQLRISARGAHAMLYNERLDLVQHHLDDMQTAVKALQRASDDEATFQRQVESAFLPASRLMFESAFLPASRLMLKLSMSTASLARVNVDVMAMHLAIVIRKKLNQPYDEEMDSIRTFCIRMADLGHAALAARVIEVLTTELEGYKGTPEDEGLTRRGGIDVAILMGGEAIVKVIEGLAKKSGPGEVQKCLVTLGLIEQTTKAPKRIISHIIEREIRSRFLIACADASLLSLTIALYQLWNDCGGDRYDFRGQVSKRLPKAVFSTRFDADKKAYHDDQATRSCPVSASSACMASIVALLTRGANPGELVFGASRRNGKKVPLPDRLRLAYHALFSFFKTKERHTMDRADMIRAAHAMILLGHPAEGFQCLSNMPLQGSPRGIRRSVTAMIGGIARYDLPRTLTLLQKWCQDPHLVQFISIEVVRPVLLEALASGSEESIAALSNLVKRQGMLESLDIRTLVTLFSLVQPRPRAAASVDYAPAIKDRRTGDSVPFRQVPTGRATVAERQISAMVNFQGWRPSANLLRAMLVACVNRSRRRGVSDGSSSKASRLHERAVAPHPYTRYQLSRMAVYLFHLMVKQAHTLDEGLVLKVITTFDHDRRPNDDPTAVKLRARRVAQLDQMVSALRWMRDLRSLSEQQESDDVSERVRVLEGKPAIKVASMVDRYEMVNALTPAMFCHLVLAYLRLGDPFGAASILQWAHLECMYSPQQLADAWLAHGKQDVAPWSQTLELTLQQCYDSNIAVDTQRHTLAWLQGKISVPLGKAWWTRTGLQLDETHPQDDSQDGEDW